MIDYVTLKATARSPAYEMIFRAEYEISLRRDALHKKRLLVIVNIILKMIMRFSNHWRKRPPILSEEDEGDAGYGRR
jgi:hypothetical protein